MQSDINCNMLHNLDKDNPDYFIHLLKNWKLLFQIEVFKVNSTKKENQKYQSYSMESYTLDVYQLYNEEKERLGHNYVIAFGDTRQYECDEPKEIINWIEDNISQADISFYDEEIMNEWNR